MKIVDRAALPSGALRQWARFVAESSSVMVIGYDGSDGARHAIAAVSKLLADRQVLVVYVFPQIEEVAAGMGVPVKLPSEAATATDERAREVSEEGAELARQSGSMRSPPPSRRRDALETRSCGWRGSGTPPPSSSAPAVSARCGRRSSGACRRVSSTTPTVP